MPVTVGSSGPGSGVGNGIVGAPTARGQKQPWARENMVKVAASLGSGTSDIEAMMEELGLKEDDL